MFIYDPLKGGAELKDGEVENYVNDVVKSIKHLEVSDIYVSNHLVMDWIAVAVKEKRLSFTDVFFKYGDSIHFLTRDGLLNPPRDNKWVHPHVAVLIRINGKTPK